MGKKKYVQSFDRKSEGERSVGRRKCMLWKWNRNVLTGFIWFMVGISGGLFCLHGKIRDVPLDSTKCWGYFNWLSNFQLLKKEFAPLNLLIGCLVSQSVSQSVSYSVSQPVGQSVS
jgi:hypothetical protein